MANRIEILCRKKKMKITYKEGDSWQDVIDQYMHVRGMDDASPWVYISDFNPISFMQGADFCGILTFNGNPVYGDDEIVRNAIYILQ